MALTAALLSSTIKLDGTVSLRNGDTNTPVPTAFSNELMALGAVPSTAINHAICSDISIGGVRGNNRQTGLHRWERLLA